MNADEAAALPQLLVATPIGLGIRDPAWFEHRLALISAITAPSLLRQEDQGFVWVVFVDSGIPNSARKALKVILAPFGGRAVIDPGDYGSAGLLTHAQQYGLVAADGFVLTGRIDDDDAWDRRTVGMVRQRAAAWLRNRGKAPGYGLTFVDGLAWVMYDMVDIRRDGNRWEATATIAHRRAIYRYPVRFPSMSGFVCSRLSDGVTSISATHSRLPKVLEHNGFTVDGISTDEPMWLYCRHKQATSSPLWTDVPAVEVDLPLAELAERYGIDEAKVRSYIARNDEYGYSVARAAFIRRRAIRSALDEVARKIGDAATSTARLPSLEAERTDLMGMLAQVTDQAIVEVDPAGKTLSNPRSLAIEVRRRLGPTPEPGDWPLVSIIVPNRDGAELLRRLLAGLERRTDYARFELIAIDNGSGDGSLDLLRHFEASFPISIVANPHNESFSDACNQGAELAGGDLLLFLNNDVELFEPAWLHELVACLRGSVAAAASATLLCPDAEHKASFSHGYGIQHRGIEFREKGGMIDPVLRGWEADPLDRRLGEDVEPDAVAAACLLVERAAFERVGGFSHGYFYGSEDVDLSLKLRAAGLRILCSGRSLVIHHPVSTRRLAPHEEERARKLGNRRLLWERWGPFLRREYELARLAHDDPRRPLVEAPGFCLHDATPGVARAPLVEVASALREAGYRAMLLRGERAESLAGLNFDIAVYVRGRMRYIPRRGQLNVLWAAAPELSALECSRYDLVVSDSAELLERLGADGLRASTALLAGPDPVSLAADLAAAAQAQVGERTTAR